MQGTDILREELPSYARVGVHLPILLLLCDGPMGARGSAYEHVDTPVDGEVGLEDIAVSVACDVRDVVVGDQDGLRIYLVGMVLGDGDAEPVECQGSVGHAVEE